MTRRWSSPSPKSARATCRCMSWACRSSRKPITPRAPSTNRRSIYRWARGPTKSGSSRSIAMSSMTGSRIGGAPICRYRAAASISTPYVMSSIATAMSRSRDLPQRAICSAKNSPRGYGRRVMTSPRSRMAASSRKYCPTRRRQARRAGSSICAATNSKTRACAKHSSMPSISNGPTRRSCTAPTSAPIRRSRIRT